MIRKCFIIGLCFNFIAFFSVAQPIVDGQVTDTAASTSPEALEGIRQDTDLLPGYVSINFKGADIRAVLNYLSDVGGVDIVPSPDVSGPISLKLTNKHWQTALDIVVRNYGFAYERDGDVIRVVTVDSLKMEELSTEVLDLNYANATEIMESIKDMLTERGKVSTDSRTNVLVITDVPANIYKIKKILHKLDKKTPQIMIEARIIETELSKDERMGIDWNLQIGVSGSRRPMTLPFNSFLPDWGLQSGTMIQYFPVGTTGGQITTIGAGGATATTTPGEFPTGSDVFNDAATRAFPFATASDFTYGTLDFTQFSAVLEYLKKRGNTEIISNPRITTLNGKEAKIFVGSVYNYISKIEIEDDTNSVTYETAKEDIGIKLAVTPNVNEDGEIVVSLKPEIKDVIGFQQLTSFFSLPIFSTREAETEVMIGNGDTIFIGGLIKEDNREMVNKFPIVGDLLGDIPFIGNLVKHTSTQKTKTELVFFITVHIVKDRQTIREFTKQMAGDKQATAFVPLVKEKEVIDISGQQMADMKKKKVIAEGGGKTGKPVFDFRKKN